MIAFLVQGGVVLVPILALSIVAVALIIQKSVFFYYSRNVNSDLGAYVIELLQKGKGVQAMKELQQLRCPEARVLLAGLQSRRAGHGPELIGLHMESQAMRSAEQLEKNVPYLASIANLATLLGLLGTVTGMIVSFFNLRVSGVSDPALLAGGISQALITTAAGLSVAIPSLFFFHIFRQKVNRTLSRVEIATSELLSFFSRQKQGKGRSEKHG